MKAIAPTVSVVMPVYNAEAYLPEAIESILGQTMRDFELIAVDDGSTDASLKVLRRVAKVDNRIRIMTRPNTGIVGALNDGLALAQGAFIARMDADDVCLPNRFEQQVAYLHSNRDCVAVGSAVLQVDPDGAPICVQHWEEHHDQIDRLLLAGAGGIAHPTAMIRADILNRIGGYRQEYQWIEDKDLWLRLAETGRLANLREPLLKYRMHEGSVCWRRENEQRRLWGLLLAETYARRQLTGPPPSFAPRRPQQSAAGRDRSKWIRAAARSGQYATALKHAARLARERPFSAHTWLALIRGTIAGSLGWLSCRARMP